MGKSGFRVGITRDNLKPDGNPIFDESAFRIFQDAGIDYEFLPENEAELSPGTVSKYDALAVMLAKVTRKTVSGPGRRLKLIARFGVGNIGSELFRLAAPFGMKHLACDPCVTQESVAPLGVKLVGMETLFRESDFLFVNCPLSDETRRLIGARQFALMKPTAYFINTARGPIVDEKALYETLSSKRIAGAGLDVFEQEPVSPDNPLLKLDNIVVTPHHISLTDECIRTVAASAFSACRDLAAGRVPKNVVNQEVLGKVAYFHR